MNERFVSWIFSYNKILVALLLIACVAGTKQVLKAIQPNNEISIWFSKNDPALQAYHDFQVDFGNDRIITLVFEDTTGVITTINLKKIEVLTREMLKIGWHTGSNLHTQCKRFQENFRTRCYQNQIYYLDGRVP